MMQIDVVTATLLTVGLTAVSLSLYMHVREQKQRRNAMRGVHDSVGRVDRSAGVNGLVQGHLSAKSEKEK
jgi:hypothetical protein